MRSGTFAVVGGTLGEVVHNIRDLASSDSPRIAELASLEVIMPGRLGPDSDVRVLVNTYALAIVKRRA